MYGAMLIGHMFGDYALQTYKTATLKSHLGLRGAFCCAKHSLDYTLSVMCCVYAVRPFENIWLAFALLFASHYVIDRYSLAKLLLIGKGYGLVDFERAGHLFMYAANDNAMHLILMFIIFQVI